VRSEDSIAAGERAFAVDDVGWGLEVEAPGARDIIRDRENGRLLAAENECDFATALNWARTTVVRDRNIRLAIAKTAQTFSMERSVEQLLRVYETDCNRQRNQPGRAGLLALAGNRIRQELLL
jgi:hypothetical protein